MTLAKARLQHLSRRLGFGGNVEFQQVFIRQNSPPITEAPFAKAPRGAFLVLTHLLGTWSLLV